MIIEVQPYRSVKVESITYLACYPYSNDSVQARKLYVGTAGNAECHTFLFDSRIECKDAYDMIKNAMEEVDNK